MRVDTRSGLPRLIGLVLKPWLATSTDLTKARGWVWEFYYLLFIPVAGGKWEGMVFDARNGSWWPFADMDAQAFATRETGTLVWGGILEVDKPNRGVVYEFNLQVSDNGSAVTAELTTRLIDARPGWWKWLRETVLSCEANPGAILTGRLIPDQSPSYVERELKLTGGPTGARMLKRVTGTKRLQGNGFQLYLKSVNLTKRPALYWWQQLIHTFNRRPVAAAAFAETFTDPDPTVAISEATFPLGTHTNTRVSLGKVTLAEDFTWVLAYDGAYARASSPVVFNGKLVVAAWDSVNTAMVLYIFDGANWSTLVATAAGRWNPDLVQGFDHRLLVAGGSLFLAGHSAVADIKTRKTVDLVTVADYGATAMSRPTLTVHGGTLWAIAHTGFAWYDAGGGAWTDVGGLGASYAGGASFAGQLHVTDGGTLKRWTGSAWVQVAVILNANRPMAHRVFSVNGKLYIGVILVDAVSYEIWEWDGATLTKRIGPLATTVYDLVEVAEPDGRVALYAAIGDVVQRTYDGVAWTNLQAPLAGVQVRGAMIYGGRRYAALDNGDVYRSAFYKLAGTYVLDQRDLGAVKTQAQVTLVATVPGGTTLQTRIGYKTLLGDPFTYTSWHSQLVYTEAINGRYTSFEVSMTGDGTNSPAVDSVEIIAR